MKVEIHATLKYGEQKRTFAKSIELPSAPLGLDWLTLKAGSTAIGIKVDSVGWSESTGLFVVRGHSELDTHSKAAVENDSDWSIAPE